MAWYFTVYEFPERITRHEAMWLPLGVISSNTAKDIPGGLSHVFKVMMKQLFEVEKIQDEGVILELDEPMRVFQDANHSVRWRNESRNLELQGGLW